MGLRLALRISNPAAWMGGVNYLLNICRILRAGDTEIEPVLFAPAGINTQLEQQIFAANGTGPLIIAERTRKKDISAMFGANDTADMALFSSHRIDLVFESAGYYGPKTLLPTLSWLPDFQHQRLPHLFSRGQWLAREIRFRRILATRRHLLLSSNGAFADIRRFYPHTSGTIHVVPFSVRLDQEPSLQECERVRLSYDLPKRFLFLPNQFWVHKNHQLVVEALGILGSRAPVVVATGNPHDPRAPELFARLTARVAELGIGDRFRILGQIPYPNLLALNACACGLINPSLFEGWSTTVEEAKALGTPLLLSDIDVHREQAGGCAIFFDPLNPADLARAIEQAMAEDIDRDDLLIRTSRSAAEKSFASAFAKACFTAAGIELNSAH